MKSNSHDSSNVVNSREHDKLLMTWDAELMKYSSGGKNTPSVDESKIYPQSVYKYMSFPCFA